MSIFNRLKNATISTITSLILFIILVIWTYSTEQQKLEGTAHHFIQKIEGLKGQVFLFNQLVSSILSAPSKPEPLVNNDEIYSLNYGAFLNSNGTVLNNRFHQIFSQEHSWLDASDLLYFKLFDSKTILSDKEIERFSLGKNEIARVFSEEYCREYFNCTQYSSSENLADEFILSEIYVSSNTNKRTFAITTPTVVNGKIIAESHLDVDLEEWESLSGMHITCTRDGEKMDLRVSNREYRTGLSWKKTAQIDNFVTVTFERHYDVLIVQGLLVLLFIFIFNVVIVFYSIEKYKHSRTKLDSMTDALTQCFNRKLLNSFMLKSMMAEKKCNTVVAFDGNKIKYINDKYGHDAGDLAIIGIANAIKCSFRKDDMVVRTGGDEFIVIALGLDAKLAHHIVNDVNSLLAQSPIIDGCTVSVSAGVSSCKHYADLKKAISNADIELYQHKREGKEVPVAV